MIDKVISLDRAVALVEDGQTIGLGGMTLYRRPVGFVRRLVQQQPLVRGLTLLGFTLGIEADMLVGMGCVATTRSCYFGLETFGLAPHFTTAAQLGTVQVMEESEASIACGLRATMSGVGFMPSMAWQGTEMFLTRPDVQMVQDPYTGETLTAFPAVGCDVAVIHVLKADRFGNALLGGNPAIDLELALVAKKVILTAEEVVEELPASVDLVGYPVTAVVALPQGAYPTSCYPLYPVDGLEILRYVEAVNAGTFSQWIQQQP